MSELTASDVEVFTGGRVPDSDETQAMLDAALVAARRKCLWHVSPVVTETVTLDGPCSRILPLPTRKLVTLNSVTEDEVILDLTGLRWSASGPPGMVERPVVVRKKSGGWWSGDYQSIVVDMEHGYTESEAADWRWAILSLVDQMALSSLSGVGAGTALTRKTVDDVTYQWANPFMSLAHDVLYSVDSLLDGYCLPTVEFV